MGVRIRRAARDEASVAFRWYLNAAPKTAEAFEARVQAAILQILEFPESGQTYIDDTRRMVLTPFPYAVVYKVGRRDIVVLAVVNLRRRPGYWRVS